MRIAVLGLGAMGSRMAARVAAADHDVAVWNRSTASAEALAATSPVTVAPSARAAVTDADVVISMVADDGASRSVWLDAESGVLAALAPDAVAIEASTVTPAMARELGAAAEAAGVDLLEAPVIGSRPQAEAGALVTLVGGSAAVLDRVGPVMQAYAGTVRHVGAVGDAATLKLAVNGLFGVQVAAYAEIVGLLERSDVDTATAVELLHDLPITSPAMQRILGVFAERHFAPNFPVRLVAKDFGYLGELAAELDADVAVSNAAGALYAAGAAGDQAELDIAGIADRFLPRG